MRILFIIFSIAIIAIFSMPQQSHAHCEIPCGIYADSLRMVQINEHIATIEKSMIKIKKLSADGEKNYNQLIRWVMNKEEHAKKIQEIATQYFMYQRIKFDKDGKLDKKNQRSLAIMHKICVYAMKCKQTTNIKYVDALRDSVHDFAHVYFPSHKH
jgi:nickel superoxide dismutase